MAINPKIAYNFNENDVSLIKDYSTEGNNGTGTGLTIQSSSRIGNECVFNDSADTIIVSDSDVLNGELKMSLHMGLLLGSTTGLLDLLVKDSQLLITMNYSTRAFTVSLYVDSGIAIVSSNLEGSVYYDIDIIYDGLDLNLYVDGSLLSTDSSQSGVISTNSNNMVIGGGSFFSLNEFKVYNDEITPNIISSVIEDPNGVLIDSLMDTGYQLGDLLVADLDYTPQYAVVTFIDTNFNYRILPISDNIRLGMNFGQLGHLWNTSRQCPFILDQNNGVSIYKSISTPSSLTDNNVLARLSSKGLLLSSISIASTYTALDVDNTIYVDTTSGDITVRMPISPVDNKEYKLIKTSSSNNLIVSGNGNNINGSATQSVSANYTVVQLMYSGTQWIMY